MKTLMHRIPRAGSALTLSASLLVALSACSQATTPTTTAPAAGTLVPASVVVAPGYTASVFAQAPGVSATPPVCDATSPACFTKPDSLVQFGTGTGASIFIAYQAGLGPDGAISGSNPAMGTVQIVQYSLQGVQQKVYTVAGHNDGLLAYDSHTLWALSNEDSQPLLSVIDINTGTITKYTPDASPAHGGGYDDLQSLGGTVYVSASAPVANKDGAYTGQAIGTLTLNTDARTFHVDPVLMGNAPALNLVSKTSAPLGPGGLGLSDPDSMATDFSGNLVLDSQGDSTLVFVKTPGAAQTVSQLPLTLYGNAWPVDDTRWAPASSAFLLLTDTKSGLIYRIDKSGGYAAGSAYSAGQGTLLQDDLTTGAMTPIITGLAAPHGLLFVK
jgi:hypothetical protein